MHVTGEKYEFKHRSTETFPQTFPGLRLPFQTNLKNVKKNMKALYHTCFYDISLNVLRPTFFIIYH